MVYNIEYQTPIFFSPYEPDSDLWKKMLDPHPSPQTISLNFLPVHLSVCSFVRMLVESVFVNNFASIYISSLVFVVRFSKVNLWPLPVEKFAHVVISFV